MNFKKITIVLVLLTSMGSWSQSEKRLDSIFSQWNKQDAPGGAAAIIKDGKVVYLKGFGIANLETKEQITPQTRFQLGELSKQFTTLAILLLEQEGKISFKDAVHKYLPELPKYKYEITIEHLLNHTSGLYDVSRVNYMIHGTMTIDAQAKALKLIASQKELAFIPGTNFSFHESVTESVLMAEITARISEQSFADFVKKNIFEPLEMKNSIIRNDSKIVLSNVAQPYQIEENKVIKKIDVLSNVVGAINAYSSAEDLTKWYANFHNPKGVLGKLIQKLDDPVRLTNGEKNIYYWGEMAIGREFTHLERGLPIFWSFGFQGAYGSNVFRYLNQNTISFVLGNNNQYNGAFAQHAIDVFVEKEYTSPPYIDFTKKKIKKLTRKKLKEFEGHYWFKEGYASELFVENDTLRTKWLFSNRDRHQKLVPLSDNTFQQYARMENRRFFNFKKKGDNMTLYFTFNESRPDIMERYEPINLSEQDLQDYTGIYYNESYASLFTFSVEGDELVAKSLNHQDVKFKSIKKDVFTSTSLFFNALNFDRDDSNEVLRFTIVTDGIHHLEFKKITPKL